MSEHDTKEPMHLYAVVFSFMAHRDAKRALCGLGAVGFWGPRTGVPEDFLDDFLCPTCLLVDAWLTANSNGMYPGKPKPSPLGGGDVLLPVRVHFHLFERALRAVGVTP